MLKIATLILLSTFALSAGAKTLELKKSTRTIFIQEKAKWELGKDMFGMPFIYFSPQVNGQRSNISFTDTGANAALDMKALSRNQNEFKRNKEEWAKSVGATIGDFTPYAMKTNSLGHKIHQISFNYKHEDKNYTEQSTYIECRGKIIFSKSLRLKENAEHDKDFDELLQTLDCGGV